MNQSSYVTYRPGKQVVRFGFRSGLCSVRVNFGLSPFGSGMGSDLFRVNHVRVEYGFGSVEVWFGFTRVVLR